MLEVIDEGEASRILLGRAALKAAWENLADAVGAEEEAPGFVSREDTLSRPCYGRGDKTATRLDRTRGKVTPIDDKLMSDSAINFVLFIAPSVAV